MIVRGCLSSKSVHPRIRGERTATAYHISAKCGSSPHTRGTQELTRDRNYRGRFIPAYAGNACTIRRSVPIPSVHPRIRGERVDFYTASAENGGSSPHTRGTRGMSGMSCPVHRFIPAYAGNARRFSMNGPAKAVHPRIRGERATRPHQRRSSLRFIPAYAGNALFVDHDSILNTVHPRIRGERCVGAISIDRSSGSSPHTRGTLVTYARACGVERFIPAYAGNATGHRIRASVPPVHPRIRGERMSWMV